VTTAESAAGEPFQPGGNDCPCGTGRSYAQCCGVWHAGRPARDAELLMRSRYCAFVLRDERYLLATWHPSRRPRHVEFASDQTWLSLKVVDTRVIGPDSAEVTFIARYRTDRSTQLQHRERSRFVRESGIWLYLDGQAP
jgi:SEC-C motif-containing protein